MAETPAPYIPMYTPGHMLENGKYRLERFLGEGSYAEVWLATDTADGSLVAIKIKKWRLTASVTIGRFEDEKITARKLGKSPFVVASLGFLRWNEGSREMLAIVYEYIDGGETLAQRIFTHQCSEYEALRVTSQILQGLILAHAKGVIHRDLKPANVLLSAETSPPTAMIGDFGIAAVSNQGADRRTREKIGFGTPQYVALEQWHDVRLATPRSDLFSVGVMLAELLEVPPLVTSEDRVSVMAIEEPRQAWLNRITNPNLRAIVQKATENELVEWEVVERRYASAKAMLQAVETAMAEMSKDEPPWTPRPQVEASETEPLPRGATAIPESEPPPPRFETFIDRDAAPSAPTENEPEPEPPSRRGWIRIVARAVGLLLVVGTAAALWPEGKPEVPEAPPIKAVEVTPKVEPKPEPPTVTPPPKAEVAPVAKVDVKPKVESKPVVKPPIVKPKSEEPKLEMAKVTTATATITTHPATAKVGEKIEIVAKVAVPDGATVKTVKFYFKGDTGANQNVTLYDAHDPSKQDRAKFDGTKAVATLPINVGFGSTVTCIFDVRIEGDNSPHRSTPVTIVISTEQ